jgi:hypothetical protein
MPELVASMMDLPRRVPSVSLWRATSLTGMSTLPSGAGRWSLWASMLGRLVRDSQQRTARCNQMLLISCQESHRGTSLMMAARTP